MSKIPGIEKALTRRQRRVAEERIAEVPMLFQGAVRAAIETGFIPERNARMIMANKDNSMGRRVIDALQDL